ncbi:MAG TPA: S1 RNA-binding domain-containing protein [Polyangia bacterium]|nr:S1 RNA-binding domain-containing protein [Polyangia bacterium]
MTDQRQPPPPDEDFAAMFAASERDGKQTRRPALAIGDRVSGKVVSVGQEVTVLDLGRGGEGTLETLELRAPDGQLTVQVGDVLEARVVAHGDRPGFVSLRRGAGHGASGRTSLEEAAATGLPVEGIVTAVNKGGVEVDVAGTRAFCPLSQLELRQVVDPAAYIGQRLEFRVTRYEDDRRGANVVLSRRALLEEEMQSRAAETRSKLVVGAVLPGVVTALKDFGAFVDVGGIEGLLPASEIGFQRNTRPADVLTIGQPITVAVMRIEKRDDPRRPEQVSFSLKSLERDPWQDAAAELPAGTLTRGQVTRVEQFGAFVELRPGVEGLLHISELGAGKQLRHARDAAKPGDVLEVTVLALDPEKRRISLGLGAREEGVDDEGRAAAARVSGKGGGMGTFGDLLKGKLPGR